MPGRRYIVSVIPTTRANPDQSYDEPHDIEPASGAEVARLW